MRMRSTPPKPTRRVWRVSASAPNGEWVDPAEEAPPPAVPAVPEVRQGSWVTSSFDLLSGTDVHEVGHRISKERFSTLFPPKAKDPKDPPK